MPTVVRWQKKFMALTANTCALFTYLFDFPRSPGPDEWIRPLRGGFRRWPDGLFPPARPAAKADFNLPLEGEVAGRKAARRKGGIVRPRMRPCAAFVPPLRRLRRQLPRQGDASRGKRLRRDPKTSPLEGEVAGRKAARRKGGHRKAANATLCCFRPPSGGFAASSPAGGAKKAPTQTQKGASHEP